ncbi:MAG: alanine racemase [Amaricoccus sp.]|uniref:alanine racemase n=1 Tax=Amaricoccus sp. TaxID=1872485 RepID=UPI0039E4155B
MIPSRHAGAFLEIDLAAIRANYRALRERLGAVDCAAVVKADAYGLGAATVAPTLAAEGATTFFVAHLDEAIALRWAVPMAEIFVLNGLVPGAEAEFVASRIRPVLNSLGQVDAWSAAGRRVGKPLPAAIQLDSGMSRLGLPEAELAVVAEEPGRLDGVALRLVMSHLACAERQDDPMNRAQRARFEAGRRRLPAAAASLANSSGIFLGSDFHFDLARPGAALYGLNPIAGGENPMRPVVRLFARIVQVREIAAGARVGYGGTFTAGRPTRIATVAVGYADGYLRSLSRTATAHFGGRPVPLVGMVSMDTATFDVTEAPDAVEGGLIELIGAQQPVDTLAAEAGTIGYEMLTSLGHRYARTYAGAEKERLIA